MELWVEINLLKIKKKLYTLIVYFLIWFYYSFVYTPLFIFWLVFWSFNLLFYITNKSVTEFKPKKLEIQSNYRYQYLFVKLILQPYVYAYSSIYLLLKTKYATNEKIILKLSTLIQFFKLVLVKIVTGLSINIWNQADFIVTKILNISKYSYKNFAETLWFNLLMEELPKTNRIEKYRIYKNKNDWKNFNPDKSKLMKMFEVIFPKVKIVFPENIVEKKMTEIITKGAKELNKESIKAYFSIGDGQAHYGSLYNIGEKEGAVDTLATNYTSKKTTLGLKNIELRDESHLVHPYVASNKLIGIQEEKTLTKLSDSRTISEILNFQDVLILTNLAVKEPNWLYLNPNTNELAFRKIDITQQNYTFYGLKELIKKCGGIPKDSIMYELDIELKETRTELYDLDRMTQQEAFNKAMSIFLMEEENYNKLEALFEKIIKKNTQ